MLYTGFKRVGSWWNFKNVISPFHRIYYIESGKGKVYIGNVPYELLPNQLFIIPKFTSHSYECENFMDHYYICLFDDLTGGMAIPNPARMRLQLPASSMDVTLIKRYIELNPHKSLTALDPQRYDNQHINYENKAAINPSQYSQVVEGSGILLQLFSRFLTEESMRRTAASSSYEKLDAVIQFINKNLDKRISIVTLSNLMCLTSDHFSKLFKKIIGIPPCEYIQMKRIERAQALLLTSHQNITQIAESVGIDNPAQFSRLFTKVAQCSPREYRTRQLSEIVRS